MELKWWMRASALWLALAGVGCASGRHLQARHSVSGLVALQIPHTTAQACATSLDSIRRAPEASAFAPYVACANDSASASLQSRATLRDRTNSFLFDVEVISVADCQKFVDAWLIAEKDKLELVAPCAPK